MEQLPPDQELETAVDQDVRSVAIIWGDNEPGPDVMMSGLSPWEAIGFLRAALMDLEIRYRIPCDMDDDEDED